MGAQEQLTPSTLTADTIRRARARAAQSGRRVMAELEEMAGLGPDEFVERLGRLLRYPVLSGDQLQRSTPLFEQIAFTEAMQRECTLVQHAGRGDAGHGVGPFRRGSADLAGCTLDGRVSRLSGAPVGTGGVVRPLRGANPRHRHPRSPQRGGLGAGPGRRDPVAGTHHGGFQRRRQAGEFDALRCAARPRQRRPSGDGRPAS